jgi:hypothetical protein
MLPDSSKYCRISGTCIPRINTVSKENERSNLITVSQVKPSRSSVILKKETVTLHQKAACLRKKYPITSLWCLGLTSVAAQQ